MKVCPKALSDGLEQGVRKRGVKNDPRHLKPEQPEGQSCRMMNGNTGLRHLVVEELELHIGLSESGMSMRHEVGC